LPEPGDSPPTLEPSHRTSATPAPVNPLLVRLELELPDGRYLLAYRRVEASAADA
jgi:hypothetical protein